MSTTASTPPAFPPPIPITYSWSTPNALRRLSLPPLSTERPSSSSSSRSRPRPRPSSRARPLVAVNNCVGTGSGSGFAGPSRSIPVGTVTRRPLPRPPTLEDHQTRHILAPVRVQDEETGQIPFPDPYSYQIPSTLVHHYQPAYQPHMTPDQPIGLYHNTQTRTVMNARPSSSYVGHGMAIAPDLVPLIHQTGRLSFSDPLTHHHYHDPAHTKAQAQTQTQAQAQAQETGRGRQAVKVEKDKKNGVERRLSITSIVARFTGRKSKSVSRSRSRSGSASRDHNRNLLEDE